MLAPRKTEPDHMCPLLKGICVKDRCGWWTCTIIDLGDRHEVDHCCAAVKIADEPLLARAVV